MNTPYLLKHFEIRRCFTTITPIQGTIKNETEINKITTKKQS